MQEVSTLKILQLDDTCTACSACMNVCPRHAISMRENHEGFLYPHVNSDLCITCKLCDKTCPVLNAKHERHDFDAFYGYSSNPDTIKASSSGGAFSAIANLILAQDGVVFGAVFTYGAHLRLEHQSTEDNPLSALMKSKYVQSYIGDSFRRVKELLLKGTKVMFVGTPCQINGLTAYLKKDYDNLLKVDIVCHGVPSMDMLRKHLLHIGFSDLSKICDIDFRPKRYSWVDYLEIKSHRKKYSRHYLFDEYFRNFEESKIIRRSCTSCLSCNGKNRTSDLTLGDFWGYKKAGVELPKEVKGLSLILANTNKGKQLITSIKEEIFHVFPLERQYAEYVYERARGEGTKYAQKKRDTLLSDIYKNGYTQAMNAHAMVTPWYRSKLYDLKLTAKQILKKILKHR